MCETLVKSAWTNIGLYPINVRAIHTHELVSDEMIGSIRQWLSPMLMEVDSNNSKNRYTQVDIWTSFIPVRSRWWKSPCPKPRRLSQYNGPAWCDISVRDNPLVTSGQLSAALADILWSADQTNEGSCWEAKSNWGLERSKQERTNS